MLSKAFTLAGLAAVASSHMLITSPVPYGKSSLNNSPLAPDGSDFPCKSREGVYAAEGASNVYAQGSKQKLAFQGSAVHGGGSCQLSVTTDAQPTKNSVWKVIKSIEGGCPAKNTPGNLNGGPDMTDPFTYDFTVPDELASGNYTLAWTWFNKVGNREMYMNCAPMTVTGSGGSDSFLGSLPDMFTANIGGCQTPENIDVQFPNAGQDVDRFGSPADLKTPEGCGSSTGGSQSSGGSPAAPASSASSAPSAAYSEPATPSVGGVFVPTSESVSGPSSPAVTPTPSGDVSAPAPSTGSGGGNTGACTSEGQWNCIDGKSFQRCASGMWTPVQPVAQGTACTPGLSDKINIAAAGSKRSLRRGMRFS